MIRRDFLRSMFGVPIVVVGATIAVAAEPPPVMWNLHAVDVDRLIATVQKMELRVISGDSWAGQMTWCGPFGEEPTAVMGETRG